MAWEALFAALWWTVAGGVIVRMFWRFDRDARLVVQTAAALGARHGHGVIESTHLALALTADEKLSNELEARGVDVTALYDDLEASLGPRDDAPPPKHLFWSEDASRVLARAARKRWLLASPRRVFFAFMGDDTLASAVLARHWSGDARGHGFEDDAGPYRSRPSAKPAWVVRIWNDDRTTMEFVVTTLRDTLMLREAHAIHAMLVTHHAGSAVVHRCERDEAIRLAKLIEDAAAAREFPLRVTAEEETRA